uniref:Gfo/Idh/MocA family oxidoreductase n=1 Tax=Bacillus altitudinis TaxID=293387 RepID=UPI0016436900
RGDIVIVGGGDDTDVTYILEGLDDDVDVITEKAMVTTGKDAKEVMEKEGERKGKVSVRFNYR